MIGLLEWLEGTPLGAIARESLYGFQILVAIHLLGIVFSVGVLLWVDLRMLGLWLPGKSIAAVHRALSKWFAAGFVVMLASGTALFAGFATSAYTNVYFRIKIAVILLAGINAVAFHVMLRRQPAQADAAGGSPGGARVAGALSLAFWAVVIVCGRMMSYTLF